MTIKKLLLVGATSLLAISALAQSHEPSWIRQTALSPDGKEIAFTYMGDLYTVPVSGGLARQITSHPAYDQAPVWSKDGQKLAFASDRKSVV